MKRSRSSLNPGHRVSSGHLSGPTRRACGVAFGARRRSAPRPRRRTRPARASRARPRCSPRRGGRTRGTRASHGCPWRASPSRGGRRSDARRRACPTWSPCSRRGRDVSTRRCGTPPERVAEGELILARRVRGGEVEHGKGGEAEAVVAPEEDAIAVATADERERGARGRGEREGRGGGRSRRADERRPRGAVGRNGTPSRVGTRCFQHRRARRPPRGENTCRGEILGILFCSRQGHRLDSIRLFFGLHFKQVSASSSRRRPASPLARLPPSSRHAAGVSTHPLSRGRQTSVHTLHGSLCHPRVVRHLLEHIAASGAPCRLLRAGLGGPRTCVSDAPAWSRGSRGGRIERLRVDRRIEACGRIAPRAAPCVVGEEGRPAGWAHLLSRPRRGGGDAIAVHALTADENLERHLRDRGGKGEALDDTREAAAHVRSPRKPEARTSIARAASERTFA